MSQPTCGLPWLVSELDRIGERLDASAVRSLLDRANLEWEDVASYVREQTESYNRRTVVRRDHYELLVLTWRPSQSSVAHDHTGSLCGLKVVRGALREQLFVPGPDGLVRQTADTPMERGETLVDAGGAIHALRNDRDSSDLLVTVHVYAPPLPEICRYAIASEPPQPLFVRRPRPNARVVAIVGGGFTGTMTLANLLRQAGSLGTPMHIVLVDRQPAIGEGVAYRTNDARHLLNVPAGRMSVWVDRPNDFLEFARESDPSVHPNDFLPRRIYGRYIRRVLAEQAASANGQISVEVVRDEVTRITPLTSSHWSVETASRSIRADLAVLTVGHRPPDDPFARNWQGPRNRFIADPWAALALSQIAPDEPVLLLGSGLTAVDAVLTLCRTERTAPMFAVSRRGLLPLPHARQPAPPADVSDLLADWLDPAMPLTIRRMVCGLRQRISAAGEAGNDWRPILDGLRPAIQQLWNRLSGSERRRFLRHARPFWEIHRHRTAPEVAAEIDRLRQAGTLRVSAGTFVSAKADAAGVEVSFAPRGGLPQRTERVSWVINCTGPGVHNRHSTHPFLRPLLEDGVLCEDAMGLGLRTNETGHAIDAAGKTLPTLLVGGTLRKATLWESTAVPELRAQACEIARGVLATLAESPTFDAAAAA